MKRTLRADVENFGQEFLDQILEWISKHIPVEKVYTEAELKEWAETHGYVKED